MPSLSPAAQAVKRDLAQIMQELSKYCRVSISATDVLPITLETNDTSLEAVINALCATALLTAVNEMSREWGYYKHHDFLRDIVAELEGSND